MTAIDGQRLLPLLGAFLLLNLLLFGFFNEPSSQVPPSPATLQGGEIDEIGEEEGIQPPEGQVPVRPIAHWEGSGEGPPDQPGEANSRLALSVAEPDTLGQGQFTRPVDGIRLAPHVALPGI